MQMANAPDFQNFHWLAGHRLSVLILAVPNMVKECVSNKAKHWRPAKIASHWSLSDSLVIEVIVKIFFKLFSIVPYIMVTRNVQLNKQVTKLVREI